MNYVIFDMDGIIFDSEKLCLDAWVAVAEKHGIPDVEDAVLACVGTTEQKTTEIMLTRYGADFPYDEYRKETSVWLHRYMDTYGLPVKPFAKELLSYLKEAGIPTGLATSTREAAAAAELRDAGLFDYFTVKTFGDMVTHSKPDPEIFLLCAGKLGAASADCIVVEDSFNGIRAAAAAGMTPVMVPDLLQPTEEIRSLARFVVPDLSAVIDLFEQGRL